MEFYAIDRENASVNIDKFPGAIRAVLVIGYKNPKNQFENEFLVVFDLHFLFFCV